MDRDRLHLMLPFGQCCDQHRPGRPIIVFGHFRPSYPNADRLDCSHFSVSNNVWSVERFTIDGIKRYYWISFATSIDHMTQNFDVHQISQAGSMRTKVTRSVIRIVSNKSGENDTRDTYWSQVLTNQVCLVSFLIDWLKIINLLCSLSLHMQLHDLNNRFLISDSHN